MIGPSNHQSAVSLGIALIVLLWFVASASGGPITTPHAHDGERHKAVHEAAHDVDEAWEVFHEAALSGTLASPAVQTEVEQYLHESRTLLLEARRALDQHDREAVEPIVGRIHDLTTKAIRLSRERKQ